MANAVFLPLAAVLSKEQLLSWGWRIPFFLSVVVVVVGFIIRRTLDETPAFKEEVAHNEVPRTPLAILFRDHWANVLRVIVAALVSVVSTIFGVYALSYATKNVGISSTVMLWVGISANAVALFAIPLWATLSDRIGRKPVFIGGALGSAVLIFAYFAAISAQNIVLIFLVGILMSGVVYSAANGVWPSFYGEMFSTNVRLSGMAIGTQIGFAIGGFSPSIAAAIEGEGSTGWVPVAVLVAVACVLSAISAATARDNYKVHLNDLGRKVRGPTGGVNVGSSTGSGRRVVIEYDVPARMRDGVVLRANVYRPPDEGAYPVLLSRQPYDKNTNINPVYADPVRLAAAGYLVVMQDVRGRYASDGDFDPGDHEFEDGYDTVQWAAGLPGSNGRVGMWGRSYHAETQWRAAVTGPPALRSMVARRLEVPPQPGGPGAAGGAHEGSRLGLVPGPDRR